MICEVPTGSREHAAYTRRTKVGTVGAADRVKGEWFRKTDELLAVIASLDSPPPPEKG